MKTFDISIPFQASDLEDFGLRRQKILYKIRKFKHLTYILGLLFLALSFSLNLFPAFTGIQLTFVLLLSLFITAAVMAFLLHKNYLTAHDTLIAAVSLDELADITPAVLEHPACKAYLQAVSAQKRSLLRMELDGLKEQLIRDKSVPDSDVVRQTLLENGISIP